MRRWVVPAAALAALDVYLCAYRMSDMLGNLEAQMVIILPGFIVGHLVDERRNRRQEDAAERRHQELLATHTCPSTEPEAHP